jgi:hypothetical protein
LSLPNYWIDDLELNKLDESNELVLWGNYQWKEKYGRKMK